MVAVALTVQQPLKLHKKWAEEEKPLNDKSNIFFLLKSYCNQSKVWEFYF